MSFLGYDPYRRVENADLPMGALGGGVANDRMYAQDREAQSMAMAERRGDPLNLMYAGGPDGATCYQQAMDHRFVDCSADNGDSRRAGFSNPLQERSFRSGRMTSMTERNPGARIPNDQQLAFEQFEPNGQFPAFMLLQQLIASTLKTREARNPGSVSAELAGVRAQRGPLSMTALEIASRLTDPEDRSFDGFFHHQMGENRFPDASFKGIPIGYTDRVAAEPADEGQHRPIEPSVRSREAVMAAKSKAKASKAPKARFAAQVRDPLKDSRAIEQVRTIPNGLDSVDMLAEAGSVQRTRDSEYGPGARLGSAMIDMDKAALQSADYEVQRPTVDLFTVFRKILAGRMEEVSSYELAQIARWIDAKPGAPRMAHAERAGPLNREQLVILLGMMRNALKRAERFSMQIGRSTRPAPPSQNPMSDIVATSGIF